jgi:hypothetical protein
LHVPHNRWTDGGWNKKLPQFLPLARWMGVDSPNPSLDELQVLYEAVAPKLFHEAVPRVLEATGMDERTLKRKMGEMWGRLGIGSPIAPRSLKQGRCNPSDLEGSVAFLLGATSGWMKTRLDRTLLTQSAGAKFEHIIVLGSTRRCGAPADRRTPYIRDNFAKREEPTELELLKLWAGELGGLKSGKFVFPEMPVSEKPLSLERQLQHLVDSGQYAKLVGERRVFVATNGGNALFVPLRVRRVLGLDDIWFSQPATNAISPVPEHWWPEDQDLMTTPSGIVRLWYELKANGCITQ